jgi:hypothetical protein
VAVLELLTDPTLDTYERGTLLWLELTRGPLPAELVTRAREHTLDPLPPWVAAT